MKAIEAMRTASKVNADRRKQISDARKRIVTNMADVYDFIRQQSEQGKTICVFSELSEDAEKELIANGYHVTANIMTGYGLYSRSVEWSCNVIHSARKM